MEHVDQLNKLIKPHLLRREKDDVENSIPGMKETLLYVEITNLQKMCHLTRTLPSHPNPNPNPNPKPKPKPNP